MSGIFGLFNQDDAPVTPSEIEQMAVILERRGPDRTGLWQEGPVGLGHTLLATTPEAVFEKLPLTHPETGCTITADVRLDNREELLAALKLVDRTDSIGDAEIILQAYLAWGEACVGRFLGDFAFAIHDPRQKILFCARDQFGIRPFYYHHTAGRFLAFASEPRAILTLKKVPHRINEGRIADFLISQLEGIDKTSTFYEEIYRLPPAHTLTISPEKIQIQQYWKLEPGPELKLKSNEDYEEAFLEVFTEAVRCRLRSPEPVGSMLSGGMDSGSVVAIAKGLLAKDGKGPLSTYSAIAPDPENCIETRTIQAALTMDGLDPHTVSYHQLDELLPELAELTWNQAEPFDNHMTLLRVMYQLAHRQGTKVVLDGVDGDTVLSEGTQIARLLRRGHFLTAYREAVGQNLFWYGKSPVWRQLYQNARAVFIPLSVRDLYHRISSSQNIEQTVEQNIRKSIISREFARHIELGKRLQALNSQRESGLTGALGVEAAGTLNHPYLTVGIERYNRVASSLAIEPRHPWLDRRLVSFCLTLPGKQKLGQGWPKAILRRAMKDHLPETVRWRRGKEHLGWDFTTTLIRNTRADIHANINKNAKIIHPYIDARKLKESLLAFTENGDIDDEIVGNIFETASLIEWLQNSNINSINR